MMNLKTLLFYVLFIFYIYLGILFTNFVHVGLVGPLPSENEIVLPDDNRSVMLFSEYENVTKYFRASFVREDGFVYLYKGIGNTSLDDLQTNSEALSYYLLWTAEEGDKQSFDKAFHFLQNTMMHPRHGYLQWRISENGTITKEGSNLASDADLRTIKALFIAHEKWGGEIYLNVTNTLATSLEKMAITDDFYFAPYAGIAGENDVWRTNEVWLGYADFTVFKKLGEMRGEPWLTVYNKTKIAYLRAQIHNGLYNTQLTEKREYGNGVDGGGYGINSLWMMIRAAESGDPELVESSRRALEFYKGKLFIDNELYALYGSNGDPLVASDTPWVYALVGRAATELGDNEFAHENILRLSRFHLPTEIGALYEGTLENPRVGQFTMQESILSLQAYLKKNYPLELEMFYKKKEVNREISLKNDNLLERNN